MRQSVRQKEIWPQVEICLETFGNYCMNVFFVSILYMYLVYVTRLRTSLLRLVGAGYRANHMYGRTHSQSLYTIWSLAI